MSGISDRDDRLRGGPAPRIVITGIGLVTPLGPTTESSWSGFRAGRSATQWLPDSPSQIVRGTPRRIAGAPAQLATRCCHGEGALDPVTRMAVAAAEQAVLDAGMNLAEGDRGRVGCVIGTSKGGLVSFASAWEHERTADASRESTGSDLWQRYVPSSSAAAVAARFDLQGAALCPIAACATGLVSVARGADLIREGYCDTVLAGSSDASLRTIVTASFQRLGVLAHGFDDPAEACRPFDRRRNGFLIGEGGAVLVLERADLAEARGARPYAEWLASGMSAEAGHLTRLDGDPRTLSRLIVDVLRRADVAPDEIDYVNTHGTATRPNDLCETRGLKAALGHGARSISCSSLKGGAGHLLGAAGSVELGATLLALRDGVVPPTVNLSEPDAECDLDYTPQVPRTRRLEIAMKISLGFGGHIAVALVRGLPGREVQKEEIWNTNLR